MDWRELPYGKIPVRLYVNSAEVARLCDRIDGTWYACLNQHLHYTNPERRTVECTDFETGKAGVEEWATRHMERLERETARQWDATKEPFR